VNGSSLVVSTTDALGGDALGVALGDAVGVASVTVAGDRAALSLALLSQPTLLIVDGGRLEEVGGPDTVAELSMREPPVRCLVLLEADDAGQMLDLLEAGALGCVSMNQGLSDLVGATESALRGEPTVPPRLLGPLLRQLVARRRGESQIVRRFDVLSPREREVLGLLAGGHDQDDIADILVISPQTVRTHIQRITTKLGVRSRVQAAHLATEHGLVDRRIPAGGGHGAALA
jgi:two-component system, NarL family, nitrate/nitrite response regulator NarL